MTFKSDFNHYKFRSIHDVNFEDTSPFSPTTQTAKGGDKNYKVSFQDMVAQKVDDQQFKHLKTYLFRSQLTMVANSRIVVAMMITKNDKLYFSETIKK